MKAVLGPATKVVYAADWSEYFGHQPADGTGDVYFHLDPLWASADIDAVGIDVYWPLADWRDGFDHADRLAGALSTYDLAYLRANIAAGEGYEWYYASPADRDAQARTPITDGAYSKPWVFRFKDIASWWLNQHFDRPAGVESATPTAWVPQSKPIWFTELGCPAVDKGANQPNVFVDPKSTEFALPYYSQGTRDDLMQRCYLQAFLTGLDPSDPDYLAGANPASTVYSGRMVDLAHVHVYAWDARPYPAFPANTDTWGDADNWRLGHWITGRLGAAPLAATVSAILADYGFARHDASRLTGMLAGFVIDRVLSAREALDPLQLAFFIDARESDGRIVFAQRGSELSTVELTSDLLVERRAEEEHAGVASTRSLMARSYLDWGQALEDPHTGAVAVLSRGSDPSLGHVGFLVGLTASDVVLLGGNQGDAVSVRAFPRARLVGLRWPSGPAAGALPSSPPVAAKPPLQATDEVFARALAHVLEMEGGYDEDPYDPGGPTNLGITLAEFVRDKGLELTSDNFAAMKAELKAIPRDTVRRIYHDDYWQAAACPELPPRARALPFRCRRQPGRRRRRAHAADRPSAPRSTARSAR